MPVQIYWNFHNQKLKVSDKNSDIFHISAQNIDWGSSNKYPQSVFWAEIKKNNVYLCKLQFYCIKMGV